MTRSVADTLSLTLPKSRARSRWRKPRRPTLWEAWLLACAGLSTVWAVIDMLARSPVSAAWQTVGAVLYWSASQRERRGIRPAIHIRPFAAWLAVGIPLIILNLTGVT